jgi:hypothetical protein
MIRTCGLLALAGLCLGATVARAEKAPLSPDELKAIATHIIKGDVVAVYQRTEADKEWKYTHYVAEVRIAATEKGDGLKGGDLVYVRYWTRAWVGPGLPPPSASGHDGLPAVGETHRIYLAKNAYDGNSKDHQDGGFNVVFTNGFEKLKGGPRK